MSNKMDAISLDIFTSKIRSSKSVNLPKVAHECKLDWFREVKPYLKDNELARTQVLEALESIKYELWQEVLEVGRGGKRMGKSGELSYIVALVKAIDTGQILGMAPEVKKETGANPLDEDLIGRHIGEIGKL